MSQSLRAAMVFSCLVSVGVPSVSAQAPEPGTHESGTYLCDIAYEDCRNQVLTLIENEPPNGGIDLSFWFMTDSRYSNAIVRRWQAGVPVRIIMDPRANVSKPANAAQLQQFQDAGIPMLNKAVGDIAHWKGMIFKSQKAAEFSGANYSPYEYVYEIPYVLYQDESIYFSREQDVVESLMRRFDDVWMDTSSPYTFYANPVTRTRSYSPTLPIAPEFNFPPEASYFDRLKPLLDNETDGIDVVMFRITDARPADALIAAVKRGVRVRLFAEPLEYRNDKRLDDAYNIDRMYMDGVHIRMRAHDGQNHQKTVRLVQQKTTVFGTSNWSRASDDNQLEVNYFTTKPWFYRFFENQFEWKWNNQPPNGSSNVQTSEFVPLPPNAPSYRSPANGGTAVDPASVTLTWYQGPWARKYDLYFGVGPNPPLYSSDVLIAPSQNTSDNRSVTMTGLLPGTTYSWKVVSKTVANVAAEGRLWTFTTSGTPSGSPAPPDRMSPVVVVYSPGNNATISGTRDLLASASDNVAVAGVQFRLDEANLGPEDRSAPFKYSWDTTGALPGAHRLSAIARDAAGNRTTAAVVFVTVENKTAPPDTNPPSVAITAPAAGTTVSATTTISADSSDDVRVAGVQFTIDGTAVGEDISAPYTFAWNTVAATNGTHTLTAIARDGAGNTTPSAPVSVTVSNTGPPPAATIVLRAAAVPLENLVGNWARLPDATAADGVALWNEDHGAGKIDPAYLTPSHYVEITFNAAAHTPYHLWIRMRAQNNALANDSLHVQFSDSVDVAGAPIYRTGSNDSAEVVLQESDGGTISDWGWADQGWNGRGGEIYFAGGASHTLRIQQREDGVIFDQIVLTPDTVATAPGLQNRDTTIVPLGSAPPPDTIPPAVALSSPVDGATVTGTTTVSASSSDDVRVAGVQFKLDGDNLGAEDTIPPYSVQWNTLLTTNGTHAVTAVARDAAANTATAGPVTVTVSNTTAPAPPTVVLHAVDVPASGVRGNWVKTTDAGAADTVALWNADRSALKITPARDRPADYVEITFEAAANTPYHLWIRMRAQNDAFGNDSIHVQFSDAVNGTVPIYRIGTASSAEVVLQESDGGSLSGWGWADQGWNGPGPDIWFATSATHTLRIQQREDGVYLDQIVLSPATNRDHAPGAQQKDTVILPR